MQKILGAAALAAAIGITVGAKAQIILSGNDEKTNCSEICQFVAPPGKDTVSIACPSWISQPTHGVYDLP